MGGVRAAELVNAYRERLERMDLLPPRAALEVACRAFAFGCVHLLAAPGQVWVRARSDNGGGQGCGGVDAVELLVLEVLNSEAGHVAVCREPCGIVVRLPLEQLGRGYALAHWPHEPDGTGPAR